MFNHRKPAASNLEQVLILMQEATDDGDVQIWVFLRQNNPSEFTQKVASSFIKPQI